MRKLFCCLILTCLLGTNAFAQNRIGLKFVFPFGGEKGGASHSTCQPQYQANNSCCEPPH